MLIEGLIYTCYQKKIVQDNNPAIQKIKQEYRKLLQVNSTKVTRITRFEIESNS